MEASLEGPTHCIFISIEIRAAFVLCKKIRASSRSQSGRRCDVDQRDLPHCEHYSPLRAAYSIFPGTLNPGVRFLLRLLGADRVCAALARSDVRRVGKEWVIPCRSWGALCI